MSTAKMPSSHLTWVCKATADVHQMLMRHLMPTVNASIVTQKLTRLLATWPEECLSSPLWHCSPAGTLQCQGLPRRPCKAAAGSLPGTAGRMSQRQPAHPATAALLAGPLGRQHRWSAAACQAVPPCHEPPAPAAVQRPGPLKTQLCLRWVVVCRAPRNVGPAYGSAGPHQGCCGYLQSRQ